MVDLPLVLDEKRRMDANKALLDVSIIGLPHMDEEARSNIIDALRRQAGDTETVSDEPDLTGLSKIKAMLTK